jgi:alpha-glucosidase
MFHLSSKSLIAYRLLIGLFFQVGSLSHALKTPGECLSYSVQGNEITFHCADSEKVRLKLSSNSVLKVWYAPDGIFKRSNESFAVINEDLGNTGNIDVDESSSAYEIFTGPLRIRVHRRPFQLQIFDKRQKLLLGGYRDKGLQNEGQEVRAVNVLRDDEHFFGLGEKSGPLDRRGRTYKMWNSDKPCYGVDEDPLYKSIPFFMSSYNYGIFFDNTYKTEFDFGKTSNDCFSFSAPDGEMIFYFIYGNDYKEIITRYTQLTGQPIMPPKWALGFSQCRGMLTNEKLTREIAAGYRQRQIPCDIIYQDIGWVEGLQNFEWKKHRYDNPKKMLGDLAQAGFKVIVSQDPVISQSTTKQWEEANSLGYLVTDTRTGKAYDMPWPWGGNCAVVDFTNPAVADWWGTYQQKPLDDGVKGFWTDMGEPAWSNEESTDRLFMRHHIGGHDEIHNVYGLTWDKIVTEQFEKHNPNQRIFQLTRAGYAGMQRYAFGWSGDAGDGNNVLEGWKQLENQIPLGLSAGMGLIPFWSCDISGYCGNIEDYPAFAELYVRWLQFGVFNPISRAHHHANNAVEPWLFGDEAEGICKNAIELKYQLFPYIYTYARQAHDTGLPMMRAMVLEYPNDPQAYKAEHQFMFGEELLVAPVTEKGAKIKRLYLPRGQWIDFKEGKTRLDGPQWIEYPVSLEEIPIFIKSGSIIPMMPIMQYIHEKPDYPLIVKIFPPTIDKKASFELYEDDGETNNYKKDIYSQTTFSCATRQKSYTINISERVERNYSPAENRSIILEISMKSKPESVLLDGIKIKFKANRENQMDTFPLNAWIWDKEQEICSVKIRGEGNQKVIKIFF